MKFIWLWPCFALSAGILGMSAAWLAVAIFSNQPCGWLAWVAAADMVFMLKLTGVPRGKARASVAMLCTAIIVILSQWLIVAAHFGFALGVETLTSASRLGSVLAWEVTRLNLQRADWIFIVLSLPLAGWLGGGVKMSW